MRHRKKINHLSRTAPHRKAMLANMASSLILEKRITTTTAKAKALRIFVEPLITRSKEDSTHSRRMVFKHLRDKYAVTELFREVAEKVGDRPGGYTRIIKIGNRLGDNADMCIIELVDFNENMLAEKVAAKPKAGRRRRGGKKRSEEDIEAVATDLTDAEETTSEDKEVVAETPAEEPEVVAETAEEASTPEAVAETAEEASAPETPAEEPEVVAETAEESSAPETPAEEPEAVADTAEEASPDQAPAEDAKKETGEQNTEEKKEE